MAVFILDKHGKPLMPCSEKRARLLLERGRARVHRMLPFTIRLVDRKVEDCALQPVRLKLDPGSKTTGIAVVRETNDGVAVFNLFELVHRGQQISETLTKRRALRRRRRGVNLRYRAPRFDNRYKPAGWLAPSLQHRVNTTRAWVQRLQGLVPVSAISTELARFDTQKLQNPEITGLEYQLGALRGYEVREYLLEKWGRKCSYCDVEHVPLEAEHIIPKSKGGTDRVSNLTLACGSCNQKKNHRDIRKFLAHDPERLKRILTQTKVPLRDAAAVNATRWRLFELLKTTGLLLETGTGGQTKWNRCRFGIPKTHALDAVCVGNIEAIEGWQRPTLTIKATGRGSYQRTRLTKHGFPRGYLARHKQVYGFQTGDLVMAVVPEGKKVGIHIGRVAVRTSGSFNIQTGNGVVQGISYRHCRLIQRNDGYGYFQQPERSVATRPMLLFSQA